ncbi:MAG: META domain-containing protein [Rhodoferax sp.]|nr:META domain-containing protein [Rhodoferax sp.]
MKHTITLGTLMLAGALNGCSYLERLERRLTPAAPRPAPAASQPTRQVNITLANTAWVAFAIDGAAEVLAPKPMLRWLDSEQISGTGGCNLFTARSRRTQDALRIASLIPNGKPCLTLPGSQEDLFFKALEQTRRFKLDQDQGHQDHQDQLVLENESGHVLARFLRTD